MSAFQKLYDNLLSLGARRLAILFGTGLALVAITGLASYYISRPQYELLYSGLDRSDVGRIGEALREAGISFDISADETSVSVRYGDTAQARMLLAEKGLPQSANTGYELFDHMGSLGLTSFMQEITRVRALEGELSRTMMTMRGVRQARVHLVIPEETLFRRDKKNASASVVLRLESADTEHIASAVRNLVAAATPAMAPESVVVMTTEGKVISAGGLDGDGAGNKALRLEHDLSAKLEENAKRTLAPYLSLVNFEVSVTAKVNADSHQINEKTFNPDSKVERSVRVIRENNTAQNSTSQTPTSVASNLPTTKQSPDGKQSNEENQKREEITNFEISERTVETLTNGYSIDKISAAIVINRKALAQAGLGGKDGEIDPKKLLDLEQLLSSAIGLDKARGDQIKISVADFSSQNLEGASNFYETVIVELIKQSGAVFSALLILATVLLAVRYGLMPLANRIIPAQSALLPATEAGTTQDLLESSSSLSQVLAEKTSSIEFSDIFLPKSETQQKLEKIIGADEEQAASVLKQWIREGAQMT